MKYKLLKTGILQIVFFVCEWFLVTLNSGYYFSEKIIYAEEFIKHFMRADVGYTDLADNVGIVMTVFFCITIYKFMKQVEIRNIISYGRDKFVFEEIKTVLQFTFFFVFEYWIVNIILIMVFCDISLLIETKFYLCNLLFFVTLFLYFIIVGFSMLIFRYLLCFKKGYLFISLALFMVLSISVYRIPLSPVYYSSFIFEWFYNNSFDALEYATNVGKDIIIIAILIVLDRLVFSRKDIILNEEQD